MNTPILESASVKVMRSYDYCHFEVTLSCSGLTLELVDEMRKSAARLADKAVEQYKVAKTNLENLERNQMENARRSLYISNALNKPESERSPAEMAAVKAMEEDRYYRHRVRYNYEDDWHEADFEDEHIDSNDTL